MKRVTFTLLALMVFSSVFSQGIEFEKGTFKEALNKAKKENKVLFMDCYTQWCGPCKQLAKTVFTQKEVGDFFNENFVNVKMDMESEEGKPLMGKYQIKAFPTLLWLDSEGNVLHKNVGGADVESFIVMAKMALDPKTNLKALNLRYEKGERSEEFLQNYILASSQAGVKVEKAVDLYFSGKKREDLINQKDWQIISKAIKNTSNPVFAFVLMNKNKFYEVVGKQEVEGYFEYVILEENRGYIMKREMETWYQNMEIISKSDKETADKLLAFIEWSLMKKDTDEDMHKFHNKLIDYGFTYENDNAEKLIFYAWRIADGKKLDKHQMKAIKKMAQRAMKLDASFFTSSIKLDAYALILNKVGESEEARNYAEKAVKLATEEQKKELWSVKFLNR